jgi:hypothetical protein
MNGKPLATAINPNVTSRDGNSISSIAGTNFAVRLRHWLQGARNGEAQAGCCRVATAAVPRQSLYGRSSKHLTTRTVAYQCELTLSEPLPGRWGETTTMWAKADMLATVCFDRLDFFQTKRDQQGKRKYLHPKVNPDQLKLIHSAILHALGLGSLTSQG